MSERVGLNVKKPEVNRDNSDSRMRKTDHPRSVNPSVDRILFLQRTVGNQAVQRLIKSGALQAKLRIGQPGDIYEQEADTVADAVIRMPEPGVQRQVDEEEEEEILQTKPLVDQITPLVQRQVEEEVELVQPKLKTNAEYPVHHLEEVQRVVGIQAKLKIGQPGDVYEQEADRVAAEVVRRMNAPQSQIIQRQEFPEDEPEKLQIKPLVQYCQGTLVQRSAAVNVKAFTPSLEVAIQRSRGSGHALPHQVREPMEQVFGADLSSVRIHTGAEANALNRALNARAFTTGRDIFFQKGVYNPGSFSGRKLIAHELVHVIQQHRSFNAPSLQLNPDDGTQNLVLDCFEWVGDLIRVLGWATLAGSEETGRASIHLLHNMFGSGEPITVPREWIMASTIWREGYESLLANWIRHVGRNAAIRNTQGESEGFGDLSDSRDFDALTNDYCIFPWCQEADQFWGSGRATFTVEGDYAWNVDASDLLLEIDMFNIIGSYYDHYLWEHLWDEGQHSRQERGWYTPFDLISTWDEPDRFEIFSRVQVIDLPSVEEAEAERALETFEDLEEPENWLEELGSGNIPEEGYHRD